MVGHTPCISNSNSSAVNAVDVLLSQSAIRIKMRLLQINPVIRMSTSTGRIMQEIGELAMQHGWESYIAYSYGRDSIKPCRSTLVPVGNRLDVALHGLATRLADRHGLASKHATLQFIKKIDEIGPDIVHIHNIHGYFLNYQELFGYLKKRNVPIVWTVHDCWLYTGHCYYYSYAGCDRWQTGCGHCPQRSEFPRSWLIDRSHRNWADKRAAFCSIPKERMTIVTVSNWMRGEMSRSMLADFDYRTIHNGIDLSVFKPSTDSSIRSKYGIGERHIVLGVAGIWSREKGLDDLIALHRQLKADEVMVLVGIDDTIARRLPDGVVAIRRTDNIGELAQLYSAADVFVNATWQDNYPTVNLEAIACGTPVVTYRTGGSIESVTADTGRVVEQGDIDGLAKAVASIRSQGKEWYAPRCRAYAEHNFDKNERYIDYLQLYDELLARK